LLWGLRDAAALLPELRPRAIFREGSQVGHQQSILRLALDDGSIRFFKVKTLPFLVNALFASWLVCAPINYLIGH
jgi:hypothetical protein